MFSLFLLLLGCEKELYENVVKSSIDEAVVRKIQVSDLIQDSEFMKVYSRIGKLKVRSKDVMHRRSDLENKYGFTIIDSTVNLVTYGDKSSYSFLIKKDSLSKNKFQNLLVELNSASSSSFTIIKYQDRLLNDGTNRTVYDIIDMQAIAFDMAQIFSSQERRICVNTLTIICTGTPEQYCGGSDTQYGCSRTYTRTCTEDSGVGGTDPQMVTITAPNIGQFGGGGGGATKPPCKQLQDALNKPVVNSVTPSTVKDAMNDLINQMSTNPRERNYEMNPTVPNESSFGATLTEGALNDDGIENYNPSSNVVSILLHCHYKFSQYSVFSLQDIQNIFAMINNGNIASPETFTSILVTIHGSRYALKIAPSQDNLNNNNQNFFAAWEYDNFREQREKTYEKSVKSTFTKEKQELGLLQFLKEQNLGLELYKADNNLNWSKLSLSITGQDVKVTPCP